MGITIWSGLVLGAIYVVVATSFTIAIIPSGVFNFAEGAALVVGIYLAYLWLHTLGLSEWVAVALNVIVGALIGVGCELLTVRPLRLGKREAGGHDELVTTVGMATALVGAVALIWGDLPLQVPFKGPTGVLHPFGVPITPVELILVLLAAFVPVIFAIGFRLTSLGQACLAVAEDPEAAALRGISVSLFSIGGFAVAGAWVSLAAVIVGPITFAIPTLANTLALGGFAALALGGSGSFTGPMAAGFAIGLTSAFATRYLGAEYQDVSVFVVLLGVLMLRPHGLGGLSNPRRV